MPAAAVIPAPIAYIKVVAVKKLVVGSAVKGSGPPTDVTAFPDLILWFSLDALNRVSWATKTFTLKKLECSKQAFSLNSGAWNNKRGSRFYFVGIGLR